MRNATRSIGGMRGFLQKLKPALKSAIEHHEEDMPKLDALEAMINDLYRRQGKSSFDVQEKVDKSNEKIKEKINELTRALRTTFTGIAEHLEPGMATKSTLIYDLEAGASFHDFFQWFGIK